jgi:L-2-hydroxyglutarate oxidase LhgO
VPTVEVRPTAAPLDIVLVGAGIMSATLATMLKELDPTYRIAIIESLDASAQESSNAWNNAGTGHAALCELNYTNDKSDGTVDITRALKVNTEFDLSRQFWSHLVRTGAVGSPDSFIHPVAHVSFVRGESNVAFLKRRYDAMSAHHCFAEMEYTEDPSVLEAWMPLVMEGRDPGERVAATRDLTGTDVDFGALTRALLANLERQPGVTLSYRHRVTGLSKADGVWHIAVTDETTGAKKFVAATFVFLGAGGGALPLLQKSGIPEGKGFAGFPVSGLWLRCDDPELAERHHAKVYGKASVGAPPMSVPHLDSRVVDGKKSLLFGPYEISQERVARRFIHVDSTRQHRTVTRRRPRQFRPHEVSRRPSARNARGTLQSVARVLPEREGLGLAARGCGAARAGHHARCQEHGQIAVRYGGRDGGRRIARGGARRLSRCIDVGQHHARRLTESVRETVARVDREDSRDGPVLRPVDFERCGIVP